MANTLDEIRRALNRVPRKWSPAEWLDTSKILGMSDLNTVLGDTDFGIPYGRVLEITGWKSQGKTSIMMALAALCQHDGAFAVWGDLENSFTAKYAKQRGFKQCAKCGGTGLVKDKDCPACGGVDSPTRGLDSGSLVLVQPYMGRFTHRDPKTGKMVQEREERMAYAQELCSEMEMAMQLPGFKKKILVLDSIAALLTEEESDAGLEGSNMHTTMSLPLFMGKLCRRWVGLAQVTNTLLVFVNQMREGPKKGFGDNSYSPGGNASGFYAHVQVKVHRAAKGAIRDGGKIVGFRGIMKSSKNKTGGEEGAEIGYAIQRGKSLEFVAAKDVRKLAEENQ